MRASRASFLSIILLLISFSLSAQILEPVKWTFGSKKLTDTEAELVFTATMDPGWHLYSQFLKPGGPIPTAFKFTESPAYSLVGKVREPKAKTEFDAIFKMDVSYFDGKAEFRQKIKILSNKDFNVEGTFEYMTCDDESCIPFFDNDFSIPVKAGSGAASAVTEAVQEEKKELGPALEMEPVDPATLTDTTKATVSPDTDAGITTAAGDPMTADDNRSL
ncbi:MAG: hypothetical protein IH599_01695, partial [Bacteroidales bacterium]|nr:hypothetical protein [Bacteroidales bacterium]